MIASVRRIEAGPYSKCGSRLSAAHIIVQQLLRASLVEGCSFSKRGSRISAGHTLSKQFQMFPILRT
eukprot:2726202-Pyramimonas_sp.AAC.1